MALVGPNCFLTAEYRTAIMVANCKFILAMLMMPTLPEDKLPNDAPNLFLGSLKGDLYSPPSVTSPFLFSSESLEIYVRDY